MAFNKKKEWFIIHGNISEFQECNIQKKKPDLNEDPAYHDRVGENMWHQKDNTLGQGTFEV